MWQILYECSTEEGHRMRVILFKNEKMIEICGDP